MSSGTAARMVNGIAVAVAGAIALQMLSRASRATTRRRPARTFAGRDVGHRSGRRGARSEAAGKLARTEGVRTVASHCRPPTRESAAKEAELSAAVTVGDCTALREVAELPSCKDGDVFAVQHAQYDNDTPKLARPGRTIYIDPSYNGGGAASQAPFTLPHAIRKVEGREDPSRLDRGGASSSPGARCRAARRARAPGGQVYVRLDRARCRT